MKIYTAKRNSLDNHLVKVGDRFIVLPMLTDEYLKSCVGKKFDPLDIDPYEPHLIPINSRNGLGIACCLIPNFYEWFEVSDDPTIKAVDIPFICDDMKQLKNAKKELDKQIRVFKKCIKQLG